MYNHIDWPIKSNLQSFNKQRMVKVIQYISTHEFRIFLIMTQWLFYTFTVAIENGQWMNKYNIKDIDCNT